MRWGKFLLVLCSKLVKVIGTMKRLLTLIALLGLVGVFAGCNESGTSTSSTDTNAPPAAASTNK